MYMKNGLYSISKSLPNLLSLFFLEKHIKSVSYSLPYHLINFSKLVKELLSVRRNARASDSASHDADGGLLPGASPRRLLPRLPVVFSHAMEAAKKLSAGAARKRRHGSTALFVAVDYAFLLAFAGFLAYLVGSRILASVASSA